MGISGRNAIVTGGASGIGRAIAVQIARDGADVAILDVDAARAETVAGEVRALGRRALAVEGDVSSGPSVQAAVARVHDALGPVRVLVGCAGIANFVSFLDMEEAAWDRMIAVHLKGAFHCARAVLPDMVAARWGRIVLVASVAGLNGGGPWLSHYSAAKAGIIGLAKALALEFGPVGITVNALAPGLIDTPLLDRSGMPEAVRRTVVERTPVQRIGMPEDIAAACAFLVSEEAGFFTGQVVSPNGGAHC
jgi:NAD(P)-dependent dehydrogenase (short-subunit alcohol dehydrogenase family)